MVKHFLTYLSAFFLLISAVPASAFEKEKFFGFANGEFLGGYSQVEDRDGIGTAVDRWELSPNYKSSDTFYWLNVYNGSYDRSSQVVAQEEGPRLTQETQTHSLSTAFKIYVDPDWSLRPTFFSDWVFVSETRDEDFGDGLYDYHDLGGGLESVRVLSKTESGRHELRAGYRFFEREYPNYQSLLYIFNSNASPETNEKDFAGHKFNLGYDVMNREEWSWGIEGIMLYKDYHDKRTINSDGALQNDTREDFLSYLNVNVSHAINEKWRFRLDGRLVNNESNLDFNDTHSTSTLGDDDFVSDYFDYTLALARPTFTYSNLLGEDRTLVFSASYALQFQHYPGRTAQDVTGDYTAEEQEDWSHTLSTRFSYPLTKNWAWVSTASYSTVSSNQDYQATYLYSYDMWSVLTGVSVSY